MWEVPSAWEERRAQRKAMQVQPQQPSYTHNLPNLLDVSCVQLFHSYLPNLKHACQVEAKSEWQMVTNSKGAPSYLMRRQPEG